METKNKHNSTSIMRQKRRETQKQIIRNLNKLEIKYDTSQDYDIKRQIIIKHYAERFKNTSKADNFIQRLILLGQFYEFFLKYSDSSLFSQKNEFTINRTRKDFQQIFQKLSKFYSNKEEIQILSKFMYNFNTLFNQMIIFCICIPLSGFIDCFLLIDRKANYTSSFIVNQFVKQFKLPKKLAGGLLQTHSIIHHYLKKFPNVIIAQSDQEEKILKSLKNVEITMEYKIHCEILIFSFLRKKYYYLTEFKSFEQKKGETSEEQSQKDIKCLIKSLILYLKPVKKMKELCQCQEFSTYKLQVQEINFSVWTYVVKLFLQLLDIKEIHEIQKDFYKEILIEIVSTSRSYSFIEEVFEKLITICQESLNQISMKNSARKVSSGSQNKAKIFSPDSLKQFLDQKKKISTQIINLSLCYTNLLYGFGLKEKSLAQCYSVMKYAEFSPQQVSSIKDMIRKIKFNKIQFKVEVNFESLEDFETTTAIQKKLDKFLKDNQQIQSLECVTYEFLN